MPTNEPQSLGMRVRQLRKERNMSLSELARRSGISRGYLHLIEKGESSPTEEKLAAIARTLGVFVSELIGEIVSYKDLPEDLPVDIPNGLREFAEDEGLTSSEVYMLNQINYRGNRPTSANEWRALYYAIKGALSKD